MYILRHIVLKYTIAEGNDHRFRYDDLILYYKKDKVVFDKCGN